MSDAGAIYFHMRVTLSPSHGPDEYARGVAECRALDTNKGRHCRQAVQRTRNETHQGNVRELEPPRTELAA